MRRRLALRLAVAAVLVPSVLAVLVVGVLHLTSVQQAAWRRAAQAVEDATGWQLTAAEVRARLLWGGAVELTEVQVRADGRAVASADRVAVGFRWRELLADPPRLETLEVDGLVVDLHGLELPDRQDDTDREADPLRAFEIGHVRLHALEVMGAVADVDVELDDISFSGGLEDGSAALQATIAAAVADREGRRLAVGPIELDAAVGDGRAEVRRLEVTGQPLSGSATLDVDLEARRAAGDLIVEADLPRLLQWYDPDLLPVIDPRGRLRLQGGGVAALAADSTLELEHVGEPVELAGYSIERLRLSMTGQTVTLEAGGARWGELTAELLPGLARVSARLDGAPVGPAMALASGPAPPWLPGPLRLTGALDATIPLPPRLEEIDVRADLRLTAPDGRLALRGSGRGRSFQADRLTLDLPGVQVAGRGRVGGDGTIAATLRADVEPAQLVRYMSRWMPEVERLAPAGGPAHLDLTLAGTVRDPSGEATLTWLRPEVAGYVAERVELSAAGGLDELAWRIEAVPAAGASVQADGTARPLAGAAAGAWRATIPDVAALAALVAPELADRVSGAVAGEGSFTLAEGGWTLGASVEGEAMRLDAWRLDSARLEVEADPDEVTLRSLELAALDGVAEGSGRIALAGAERPVAVDVQWEGIDIGRLPLELPPAVAGGLDGELQVRGTVERPEGELDLRWSAEQPAAVVRSGSLHVALSDGTVRVVSEGLDTAAGPLALSGTVPLGDLPRPPAIWPDAPGGALELSLAGIALDFGALAAALGREVPGIAIGSDVTLDVRWSPIDPEDRHGRLLLTEVAMRHAGGVLTAPDGIEVRLDGGVLVLERARLVGPRGVIDAAGELDTATMRAQLEVDGELSPEIAQLIPYPVRIVEPISLKLSVRGPVDRLEGSVSIDHRGGSIVLRDPPVEVTDLHLAGSLVNGKLWIDDGTAGVNRGRASLGGGWDPETGQGLVMELENVTFFAAGTLTRWGGLLSVEPDPDAAARVVGDLVLEGGVWNQPVDIAGVLLSGAVEPAVDDPLREISLDLEVRARTGIRVDNNLGRFDVRWDRLRIGGSAAEPIIRGDVRIAPGGVINLPGKRVELQRGTVRFTGDPTIDPVLELVPVDTATSVGGDIASSVDTAALAAQALYGGIGRALGFENETLQPADIAVKTETDQSRQFVVGQRLSPNLAFFFAANPSDVRDRTTMLQLWNMDFNPGLAIQGYQRTLDESSGVTALQRLQWGGSAGRVGLPFSRGGAGEMDRPIIHRVRLEGDWPISARELRRAAGLRRGLPYDPFLGFVAELRLEQRLAAEGFPDADVSLRVEGSERSPTLVYTVVPGPRFAIEFEGDRPRESVQREVRALYMPPPLEAPAFENMRETLMRHYRAEGFPNVVVEVERRGDAVVLTTRRGEPLAYRGPEVVGVPERGARLIRDVLGSPAELAAAVEDPERVRRVVSGLLAGVGYPEARLSKVETVPLSEGATLVRLVIDPGEVARISAVEVRGRDPLGLTEDLGDDMAVGAVLDRRAIDDRVAEIRRSYQRAGFDQSSVRAVPHRRDDGSWIVVLELEPGLQRTLDQVQFSGLRHINPRFLRPGLELAEGDLFNVFEVDESAIRIANFAPVERVEVVTRPTGGGGSVVDFEVFEKPRWTVELGLGWDSERGLEVRSGVSDNNLFGRGVGADLRLRWSDTSRNALLYGSLPPLPGRRISFGSTLAYSEDDRELVLSLGGTIPYQEVQESLSFDMNYLVLPGTTLKPYVRFSRTSFDYQSDFLDLDRTITTNTLGGAVYHDRFDNLFDPRRGYSLVADVGWSTSYLGSDLDTLQVVTGGSLALEPSRGWTWLQTARLGSANALRGTELDPAVRFRAGGQGSIRGFDFDSVGPVGFGGRPLGGGALFILNEELRMPLWGSLRGAAFTDLGQVWETWGDADGELSMAVGLGLRWSTPIGLIWGDVAWPVANVGVSSRDPKFYVGIGRPF